MTVEFSPSAEKRFFKLDKTVQKRIRKFVLELQTLENPRLREKVLRGDFRRRCATSFASQNSRFLQKSERLIITVVELGHRREVYAG